MRWKTAVAIFCIAGVPQNATSQDSEAVRRPQFLLEVSDRRSPVDIARSPSLTQRVTLDLTSARLADAIGEVSRQTGMTIAYATDVLGKDRRVDLHARGISVAAALTELLLDCDLDVVMRPDGSAALVPRRRPPAPGSLAGKVTDAVNGAPLPQVAVTIDGTQLGAITREDGTYRIARIPAGSHGVSVRRVGYAPARKTAIVADDQETTLDVQLTAAAASLQAQVSTATGQQRRVELGNTVATIDVGSRTETAPVKNVGDLLTAQMTGVQVSDANLTGGASRVRIRGQNSMALNNDPIYIIDGVRMTSATGGASTNGISSGVNTVPSRVNDIDPEQIESIEVVKGPSAATLYGTDAANGVIVITTKRGRAGAPVWSFHGEQGRLDDRNDYPAQYNLLGKSPGATNQRGCFAYEIAGGTCLLDSAVSLDVYKNPELTTLKLGSRQLLGGQVSGGTDALRYLLSADLNNETGPVGIPQIFEQQFKSQGVALPLNVRRPNGLQQLSLRSNLNASVNPKLDVSVSAGLTNVQQRFPQQGNTSTASYTEYAEWGPGYDDGSVDPYGNRLYGWLGTNPGRVFQQVSRQNARRFIGSSNANWRPLSWLQARGDLGYDMTNQQDYFLIRPGEYTPTNTGTATDSRTTYVTFTNNLGATATWNARSWAQLRSTVGTQFVMRTSNTSSITGTNLPPGGESPSQATTLTASSTTNPSKTLGSYVEEQLALRDRLFLTGAVRTDRNSAFGVNYGSAYYPKASLSWLLSDESFFPRVPGLDQLRARASYGASGVQPGATSALRLYSTTSATVNGVVSSGLAQGNPGNPNLKPERSGEFEGGLDARIIGGRANLELTYYKKNTHDALINQPVAPSAGVSSFLANLGGVQNAGVEYRISAQVIDGRSIGWDVNFAGSYNKNKITSLGGFATTPTAANQVGYPVNSFFLQTISWNDANGDGELALADVTVTPATAAGVHYAGQNLPPAQMTISSGVELFGRRLRLFALADRKQGGVEPNGELSLPCQLGVFSCVDEKQLGLPLWRQARGIARLRMGSSAGYVESSDYTRLREVSATYSIADKLASRIGAKNASITASARNVKLWTKYTGTDPEAFESSGTDTPSSVGGVSGPPMYYMLRFNLNY